MCNCTNCCYYFLLQHGNWVLINEVFCVASANFPLGSENIQQHSGAQQIKPALYPTDVTERQGL